MVRDEVMRKLVPSEPITPLIEKVVPQLADADCRFEDCTMIEKSHLSSLLAESQIS